MPTRIPLAAVAALALVLAGCASSAPELAPDATTNSTAEPTGIPVDRVTEPALAAALPDAAELPADADVGTCPGEHPLCGSTRLGEDGVAVVAQMPRPGDGLPPVIVFEAGLLASKTDAGEALETWEQEMADYVGAFDIPAETTDAGYTFGQRGTGSLDPTERDGWTGFVATRTGVFTDPDGGETPRQGFTLLALQRGPVALHCSASLAATADTEATCYELVTGFLERLASAVE